MAKLTKTLTMFDKPFEEIKADVLLRLKELNGHLSYHNPEHTLDVVKQSERIALEEGVDDPRELFLLKVAALYHDTGFLRTYSQHEEESCDIFLQSNFAQQISDSEKELITGLIMVTKIPQQPKSLLQKIICDADLDYLGRDDFFEIADNLRKEFLHFKIVHSNEEWEKLQMNFLKNHQYHTHSSRVDRDKVKQLNFTQLV
jgi:HD superfamily phosphodiesterase